MTNSVYINLINQIIEVNKFYQKDLETNFTNPLTKNGIFTVNIAVIPKIMELLMILIMIFMN